MPILTQGAEAAEKISDENKAGGVFRLPQLVIKDGETFAVHFVTEQTEVITMDVHQFIETKPKPEGWPGDKYPKTMWAICQLDRAFRLRGPDGSILDEYEPGYGDCYIHNHLAGQKDPKFGGDMARPASQVYGLAVMRKPVNDPVSGNVIGFADETVEFTDDKGAKYQIPKLVIVSQKYSNFWHPVKATAYLPPHTIRDKDYIISRKGNEYTIGVAAHTPDLMPGTPAWGKYEEALILTGFDLGAYLIDHSTPDHYARFFDPEKTPSGGYGRKGSGDEGGDDASPAADGPAAAGSAAVDPDVLKNFQESLSRRGKPQD
jgi:hypothetical protein